MKTFNFKLLMKKKSPNTATIISTVIAMIFVLTFRIYESKVSCEPNSSKSLAVSPTPSFECGSAEIIMQQFVILDGLLLRHLLETTPYLELLRWEEGLTTHDMINNTVKVLEKLG